MASLEKRSQYAAYAEPSVSAGREGPHVLTPSPSTRSGGSGENLAPASKRRRINFACEYCRSRKTRCDEGHPSCYACSAAGIECVTKNRRQPWVDVRRHEAGRVPESSRTGGAQKQGTTGPDLSLGDSTASLAAPSRRHEEVVISPRRRRRQEHRTSEAIDVGESITRTSNERSSRGQPFVLAADAPVTHSRHATQDDDDRPELNTRLPIVQIDSGNTPLELMTSWLDLARYRLQIPRSGHEPANQPTRALSSDCTRSYGDSVLPNSLGTWKLPEQRTAQALLEQFLDGPNVLFPLLQPDKIRRAVKTASLNGTNSLAKGSGLSVLMQVYLVMVLGYASKPGQKVDFDAEGCLKYSESLLGLILQQSKIEALQAVTLLSMALRCYDNLAAAGHTMSLAVSMGVALGLPRYSPRLAPGEERRTTWMSVFAFEKLLAFELGRSSLIPDDYPEVLPDSHYPKHPEQQTRNDEAAAEPRKQPQATFEVVLSLAKLLGDVGRACVQVSRKEDDRSDETMAEVIKEKVRTTGLSCLRLTEWASETCPSRYNPNTDILFDDELHPFTSFITMQYHLALILIRRNSLLISEKAIRLAVDVIAKNEPWEFAVRNGQSLCVNSARKILRLFLDCSEHENYPALPSLAAPLHAMGVLAVFVATRPDSRMASMDREMLKATAVAIKDQQTSSRVQKELDFAVNKFDALVGEAARSHGDAGLRSAQRSRAQSPRLPTESTMREQALGSAAISKHRVAVDSNDSTAQGNGETIEDSPGQWMGSLERDDNLAYSAWWAEDESPMIMDEFGWNWANFSQLLDGHGDEPQMLV